MQDQAGTVMGGSHDSSSPQTPRSIRPEMTGSSLRMSSNRIFGAAQSRPMIITRLASDMGGNASDQLSIQALQGWRGLGHPLLDDAAVALAVAAPQILVGEQRAQRGEHGVLVLGRHHLGALPLVDPLVDRRTPATD